MSALIVLLIACAPRAPADLEMSGDPYAAMRPGDPLVTLSGGPLGADPLVVPLWIAPDLTDDKAALFNEVVAFVLDDGRIYVHQHSLRASPGEACSVLDPRDRTWEVPQYCLRPELSHFSAASLGADKVGIWSDVEGIATFQIVTWTPKQGQPKNELVVGLGSAGQVEARREGEAILLDTACLPEACGLGEPTEPVRSWRWTPTDGLTGPL